MQRGLTVRPVAQSDARATLSSAAFRTALFRWMVAAPKPVNDRLQCKAHRLSDILHRCAISRADVPRMLTLLVTAVVVVGLLTAAIVDSVKDR